MDPDATLAEIRAFMEETRRCPGQLSDSGSEPRLLELWDALDEWLTKGGFLPRDWAYPRRTA